MRHRNDNLSNFSSSDESDENKLKLLRLEFQNNIGQFS